MAKVNLKTLKTLQSIVSCSICKIYNCPLVTCSLYVPLHWGAILTHDHILKRTPKWLFLNFYCDSMMLPLGYGSNNRFNNLKKHILGII